MDDPVTGRIADGLQRIGEREAADGSNPMRRTAMLRSVVGSALGL
jgi:hypothetical protein